MRGRFSGATPTSTFPNPRPKTDRPPKYKPPQSNPKTPRLSSLQSSMSSIVRPPDPCLVAIILIVRSRAGPRFVFHYPPNPLSDNGLRTTPGKGRRASRAKSRQGTKSNDSSSSEADSSLSDEDDDESHLTGSGLSMSRRMSSFGVDDHQHYSNVAASPMTTGSAIDLQRPGSLGSGRMLLRKRDVDEQPGTGASDRQDEGSAGPFSPPWESLLGLPADVWEKLLSPTRSWHKRRFEVGINDLAFVGWPVFVREDGTWRKQKRKKNKRRSYTDGGKEGDLSHNDSTDDGGAGHEDSIDAMVDSTDTLSPRVLASPDLKRTYGLSGRMLRASTESLDGDDKDSMTMFNVIFVVDPPLLEYSIRTRNLYDNIIKKLSKALKWEQGRTDYVWREAQHISHLKDKAKEKRSSTNALYTEILSQSSLARAIHTVYTSISASKIASVTLSPDVSISLQIPPLTSTPYLPGPTEKSYPGLWLTTADSVTAPDDPTSDENTAPHQVLAKHFALLLLDNETTIIKDVEASGGTLAPALAHYIRCSTPTKSFAQISAVSGIPLSTIQMLASHLVYWRRARAIPPLHQRDTYFVSPNCDLSKLDVATAAFQQAFPTLPSLPKMLSSLSGVPKPYGSFIPSKDHKETYFAILAWLLRGGWVTQLRSFARVRVPPQVKMAVERALRKEEVDRYLTSVSEANKDDRLKGDQSESEQHDDSKEAEKENDVDDVDDASSSSSSSLGSQGSGEDTPLPEHQDPVNQTSLSRSFLDRNIHLETATLISSPHRASPLESRWLEEIVARFPQHEDILSPEGNRKVQQNMLRKWWPTLIKYFNGYDALEKVPIREGLKRKPIWQVLTRLGLTGSGQSSSVGLDPAEQVLISVRHW